MAKNITQLVGAGIAIARFFYYAVSNFHTGTEKIFDDLSEVIIYNPKQPEMF